MFALFGGGTGATWAAYVIVALVLSPFVFGFGMRLVDRYRDRHPATRTSWFVRVGVAAALAATAAVLLLVNLTGGAIVVGVIGALIAPTAWLGDSS
jgi:uncharacterized membrane-anchored protein